MIECQYVFMSKTPTKYNEETTNSITSDILKFLFYHGIFAWRQNTQGTYDPKIRSGFRAAVKTGVSDILALLPNGPFLAIEVKKGKDRLRPEQIGFLISVYRQRHHILVVSSFDDFAKKFNELENSSSICYNDLREMVRVVN